MRSFTTCTVPARSRSILETAGVAQTVVATAAVVGSCLLALGPLGTPSLFPSAQAAEAPDTGTVVFEVVDSKGAPIVGADVGIWNDDDMRDVLTDANGIGRLADVATGTWTGWAAAEGHTAEESAVAVVAGDECRVSMKLGPGIPFSGRVVDDSGAPVAEAYVEAIAGGSFEGYSEFNSRSPYDRVFCDEKGTFRIRGIPPGAVATLQVSADGMAAAQLAVRAQGDAVRPAKIEIVLDRGGVVVGHVVSPDDAPVENAVVWVVPADEPRMIENPRIRVSRDAEMLSADWARTGADGAFEIIGLRFGRPVVVFAEARGFARSRVGAPFTPGATARLATIDLKLAPAARLEVRLVTPEGEPFTDANVRLGSDFAFGPRLLLAEERAQFELSGLPDGSVDLNVKPTGFLPIAQKVLLVAGDTTRLTLTLDPGAVIEGVVSDESGNPVGGIEVALDYEETHADGSWSSGTAGSTKTDAEGRFRIVGLRRREHSLRATKRGVYVLPADLPVTPPVSDLDVVVRKMGTLRVRFVVEEGGPAVPDRAKVWRWDLEDGGGMGSVEKLSDGVLALPGGRGDRERLSIEFDEFVPFAQEIRIPWGKDVDLGEIVLDPGVALAGTVASADGTPIAGALVAWGDVREAVTAEDGSFSLPHVVAGEIEIEVDAEGYLPLETTVPADKPAALVLHRGGMLSVRLLDGEGEPRGDHWLQFRRPPTSEAEPKGEFLDEEGTDRDGRLSVRLPAGRCRVLFISNDEIHVLAEVDVNEGGREELTLELE